MNLRDVYVSANRIEHKSMNELRVILWQRGISFPDDATRNELEYLVLKGDKAG